MDFDQMGKQHISKRRKPSPLYTAKHSPSSFDTGFSQQVWPRPGRVETVSAGKKTREPFFGVHTRKRSRSYSAWQQPRRSAGFSIPVSLFKNLVLAAGVLIIGVIGTNWDGIAATFRQADISAASLVDTPFKEAAFTPISPWIALETTKDTSAAASSQEPSLKSITIDLTETFSSTDYFVRQGDNVSKIAERFSLAQGSIIALNKMENAWNLKIGSTLKIPNMDGIPYTVQKNDSISRIAEKMKVPQNAILDANDLFSDTIQVGDVLFIPGARMDAGEFNRAVTRSSPAENSMIFPVTGRITSSYGWREDPVRPVAGQSRFHKAVDLAGKIGDPIKAAMQGTVLYVDNNPNLGNFMILKHGEYQTLYAHLSEYSVKAGQAVQQGQEIGKVGNTGYTTGPHLHFEVFKNGNRINPLDLLK